jgi:ABC-type multidrug transport system fused ATPase/permease subunit
VVPTGYARVASWDPLAAEKWRPMVALVTQEVHVFAGRLCDDLRLARPGLEAGRVVERGKHGDLAAGDGTYAQLWSAWSAAR